MTIETLRGKLGCRFCTFAGEAMQKMVRGLTALVLAGVLHAVPAVGQALLGTFTPAGAQAGTPVALQVSVSGGQISGLMGTGVPGANPPVVPAAAMVTQVQGTAAGGQWVVRAGRFTLTGSFNGTSYSGSYTLGAGPGTGTPGGVFSLSTAARGNATRGLAAPPAVAANGVVGWLAAPPQAAPPPPVEVPWLAATPGPGQGVTPIGTGKQAAVPPVRPAIGPVCGAAEPGNAAPRANGLCNGIGSRPVPVPPTPPVTKGPTLYCGQISGPQFGDVVEPVTITLAANSNTALESDSTILIGQNLPGSGVFSTTILPTFECEASTGPLAFQGTCTPTTISAYTRSSKTVGYGHLEASTARCGDAQAPLPAPTPAPGPVPAPVPPVPPVPPTPPGPVTCPISSPVPEPYVGTMTTTAGVQEPIAFNLVTQGGTVRGTAQIGSNGNASSIYGTLAGQLCSVRTSLGAVFQGTCDGKTFSGTYNTASGAMHFATSVRTGSGTTWTTACGPGPEPPPVPAPVPVPVVCPAAMAAATQTYRGTIRIQDQVDVFALDLNFSGGNITGMMGIAQPGTTPQVTLPVHGTMSGGQCHLVPTGDIRGTAMSGACDGHTFTGTYSGQAMDWGFTSTNTTPDATAGCIAPAPVPTPTPVPGPIPGPTPFPTPTPPVIRYCGTFTNTTRPFTGAFEVILVAPNTFQGGTLLIGPPKSPTVGADFGGGGMSGDWASCSGVSDAGFRFLPGAVCTATTISGRYSIPVGVNQFQDGVFSSTATTAAACPE
jgi:hypothetical protein